jgi:hypothetical protein
MVLPWLVRLPVFFLACSCLDWSRLVISPGASGGESRQRFRPETQVLR